MSDFDIALDDVKAKHRKSNLENLAQATLQLDLKIAALTELKAKIREAAEDPNVSDRTVRNLYESAKNGMF